MKQTNYNILLVVITVITIMFMTTCLLLDSVSVQYVAAGSVVSIMLWVITIALGLKEPKS